MKEIQICDKNYKIGCSAFTTFQYKKIFGTGLLKDIFKINEYNETQNKIREELEKEGYEKEELENKLNNKMAYYLEDVIEVILQIAYIEILTATPNFKSFEEWLKELPNIDLKADWISEVTELAVSSFR